MKRSSQALEAIESMETELKPQALTEKVDALLESIIASVSERQEELKGMDLRRVAEIMSRVAGVKLALSKLPQGEGHPFTYEDFIKQLSQ